VGALTVKIFCARRSVRVPSVILRLKRRNSVEAAAIRRRAPGMVRRGRRGFLEEKGNGVFQGPSTIIKLRKNTALVSREREKDDEGHALM